MSTLVKGTARLSDGREETFVFGPRERIFASRDLKVKLTEDNISEEVFVYMVWSNLKRTGKIEGNLSFDSFLELLEDYEVDADPESVAPPA